MKKTEDFQKSEVIRSWLQERNQLIILYCKLTGKRNQTELPDSEQINLFCDILIDYVSAGHFEVYQSLVKACEKNGNDSIFLLEKLYPQLNSTTDIVVRFNDKYSNIEKDSSLKNLDNDLSQLGEAIAKRIDLEDLLIENLKSKH
ncbi:MAG: sigma D regulator [Gammaproteobacteria bacterium]|nr:sigma D regulator [Gammaproteobacteria bacterium]MDH5631117.1 sigma D regulator [Gammaproteobacteria bacterium]